MKHLKLNDYEIYRHLNVWADVSFPCPSCSAPMGQFVKNGSYTRHLVFLDNNQIRDELVEVKTVLCTSCRKTHALLYSILTPYSSYGIRFIISLIHDRLTGRFQNISSLCECYDISERTFYRLWKRLLTDAHFLNVLLETYTSLLKSVNLLADAGTVFLHHILKSYFDLCGYSFMQPHITFRQSIKIHDSSPGIIR